MIALKKHPGRLQLLLLAGLFGLPLAAAIFLHVSGWRPTGTTNTGVLITPPRVLPGAKLMTANGTAGNWDTPAAKWRLVYVAANGCDDRCRAALIVARQVRLAQGKERDRVARTLLLLAPSAGMSAQTSSASDMQTEADLTVLRAAAGDAAKWRAAFQAPVGGAATGLFVVDPLGNVMMFYPADADPSGMRKDLKRLLQVSQIG